MTYQGPPLIAAKSSFQPAFELTKEKMTKRRTIRPLSFLRHSQLRKEKRVGIGQLFNSLA
jgi:hypothetical protein